MQCCSVQEAARLHSSAAAFQQPAQPAAQQRQWSSRNAALHPPPAHFFFLRAVTYLGSWPLVPLSFFFFFWTSSRVLLLGYTPGYGGREKGDMGVRGMGGGCQYLEECLDRYRLLSMAKCQCETCGGQNGSQCS